MPEESKKVDYTNADELSRAIAGAYARKDWPTARQIWIEAAQIAKKADKPKDAENYAYRALEIVDDPDKLNGQGMRQPLEILAEVRPDRIESWLAYCAHRADALKELRLIASTGRQKVVEVLRNSGILSWIKWFEHSLPNPRRIDTLPRGGQGWPAIRLRRLRLENIKCFEDLELDLSDEDGIPRVCTTIVGDNATGKTALLQAIALGCLGPELANQIEDIRTRNFLRNGAEDGAIELEFELSVDSDATPHERDVFCVGLGLNHLKEDFRPLPDNEMMFGPCNSTEHLAALRRRIGFQWGLCCGYGAFRGLKQWEHGPESSSQVELAIDRVMSLFKPWSTLIEPVILAEIFQADISSLSKEKAHISHPVRDKILETFREIIPGMEILKDEHQRKLIEKYDGVSTLSELSDGCNAMLGLLGHLVRHALELYGWEKDPFEAVGIVLIDEVDLHLHPTWQRKALFQLQRAFPKLQFIVTTHSPLVLGGVPDGQIHVLKRDENERVRLLTDAPSVKGWRVDQLFTGVHFDVSSEYDLTTEKLIDLYAVLLNQHGSKHPDVIGLEKTLDELMLGKSDHSSLDKSTWKLLADFVAVGLDEMSVADRTEMLAKLWKMMKTKKGDEGAKG